MPNGGSDCCGNCIHNRAVQEIGRPKRDQFEKFAELSYCTLRDVNITHPFWTYCRNRRSGGRRRNPSVQEQPIGWIFASGLYENSYVRIPWNGPNEPHANVATECCTCGRKTDRGITVEHEGATLGFCTNRHYVEWWKTIHDDPLIRPDRLQTPEQRYEGQGGEEETGGRSRLPRRPSTER